MTNGEYRKLWRRFDTSGDGSISYAEVGIVDKFGLVQRDQDDMLYTASCFLPLIPEPLPCSSTTKWGA